MKWRNLGSDISVNGAALTEYEDQEEHPDGETTSCWIASEAGKEYEVGIEINGTHPPVEYDLIIDGDIMHEGFFGKNKSGKWHMKGMEVEGGTKLRKFKFTVLNSTDDDDEASRNVSNLGSIRLEIYQCELIQEVEEASSTSSVSKTSMLDQEAKVHEQYKKMGLHCTSLGEAHPVTVLPRCHVETCRTPKGADTYQHTFIFKYGPIQYLSAKGVVVTPPGHLKRGFPGEEESEDNTDNDVIRKCSAKIEDGVEQDEEGFEEICKLEGNRSLLAQGLEGLQRDLQKRQESLKNVEEELKQLKAGRSKPRRKKVKLEYQERLNALNGQVFEISD